MSDTTWADGSMRAAISRLGAGESYSRSERFDFDSMTRDGLAEANLKLRNTMKSASRRASEQTGFNYSVETGEWMTHGRDIVVTAIVTRNP